MRFFNERFEIIKQWVGQAKIKTGLTAVLLMLVFAILLSGFQKSPTPQKTVIAPPVPTSKPTETPFTTYTRKPTLAKLERYDIYLIGDSMMHAFGPRGGKFTEMLSAAYPGTFFEVSNYAEANQNILSLPARMHEPVQADHDLLLQPILDGEPELIIIESFGYNPLSQFGRAEGIKKQNVALTAVMTTLTNRFPHTHIMFLATIAPDKKTYAQKVTLSSPEGRWAQAEERIEYITNHIDYANKHNIPIINAYQESLDGEGDGDTKYINPDDNIHPSEEGLSLMGRVMTGKIMDENIFPKTK